MPSVSFVILFFFSAYFCGFCFYFFFLSSNRYSFWTNLRVYCHLLAEDLRAYCALFTMSAVATALMVAMLAYFGLSLVKHLVIRIIDRCPAAMAARTATTLTFDLLPNSDVDLETEETECGKKEKYDRDPFCTDLNCVRCNKPSAALMKALDRIRSGMTEDTTMEIKEAETWTRLKETVEKAMEEVKRKRTGRLYEYPGLLKNAFWSSTDFASLDEDVKILEENFDVINAEYRKIDSLFLGWKLNKTSKGTWYIFHLINQGKVVEYNSRLCPRTFKIVKELNNFLGIGNIFANVAFSKLIPESKISAHYGPTNMRLRCHLPLKVPEYCHMKVDGTFGCWTEGRCLLFDDFLLHSAQNEGEATEPITKPIKKANVRVVLLLDLWHPQLGEYERRLLSHIFSCDEETL